MMNLKQSNFVTQDDKSDAAVGTKLNIGSMIGLME